MNTLIYKSTPFEVKDLDEEQGIVKGKGSVFMNEDSDGDIIHPGSYTKTIKENGHRVKYLKQHDIWTPVGVMKELYETMEALMFVAKLALNTIQGKDFFEQIKFGLIDENSVGILPMKKENEDGKRHIYENKLFEISGVTLAANELAVIEDVKGLSDNHIERLGKRYDNIIRILRKGSITDELGYSLESELESLKALTINKFTKPSVDTLPDSEDSLAIDYLFNKLN